MTRSVKTLIAATQILVFSIPVGLHAREFATRASARTTVNRNTNVNRNVNMNQNVNVNRNVNVNVNRSYGAYGGCCYHPVAAAAAVTAAAITTAVVVGSIVHSLPASCSTVVVNYVTYQQCGGTWYQPQFVSGSTTYVVVKAP